MKAHIHESTLGGGKSRTIPMYIQRIRTRLQKCGYGKVPSWKVAAEMNRRHWWTVNGKTWTPDSVRVFASRYGV